VFRRSRSLYASTHHSGLRDSEVQNRSRPNASRPKGKDTRESCENWMYYPLIVDCPTCGETSDGSDVEAKFWQKELPASPRGFSNRLAPPLSRPDPLPRKTEVHILFTVIGLEVCRLRHRPLRGVGQTLRRIVQRNRSTSGRANGFLARFR
jgi:hypothetical protein